MAIQTQQQGKSVFCTIQQGNGSDHSIVPQLLIGLGEHNNNISTTTTTTATSGLTGGGFKHILVQCGGKL